MKVQIYYQKWNEKLKNSHELLEKVIRNYASQKQIKLPEKLVLCDRQNQKPFLENVEGIYFSISHSGDWWSCAIAPQEIGLDIQQEQGCKAEHLARRFFHPLENEWLKNNGYDKFCEMWAYKESYVKYTGQGLTKGMDYYSVVNSDGELSGVEGLSQQAIVFQTNCYMVVTAAQAFETCLISF